LPARTEVNCLAVLGDFLIAGTDGGGGTESNSIGGLAFSPDGKTVVSGSDDGTIRVLTATNLAPCGPRIVAHRGEIKGLCFHPDGKTLASLGEMEIRLWNWPDLTPASEPAVSRSDLSALAYMPDGVLVSIGESEIRRWNGKTLAAIGEPVPICQVRPDQLAVRADGLVATGASDGGVIIWNLRAGNRLLTRLKAHAACGAAFVGPDRLVTAGESGVIRTWSAPDARLLRESRAAGGRELRRLAVSSLGRVAVGLDNGMIQFFDPEMGRLSEPGLALNGMVHGQAFNAAGDRLWACDFIPGSIAIIDVRTNAPAVSSVDAGLGELSDISLSPDEKILAAVGERGLRLFDARDLRPLTAPIKVPEGMMSCVAFTPDGALAVTGGSAMSKECEIRFLDGRTGQPAGPAIWTPPVQKLCLLQGGKIMAGGGFSGEVRLWDVRTRRPVGVLQGRETWVARHLDAGPAGKLAVAFDDGDVEIWDVDPASWMVRARLIANRALTAVERARYLESRAEGVVR
jgi:WD40 repeat protein